MRNPYHHQSRTCHYSGRQCSIKRVLRRLWKMLLTNKPSLHAWHVYMICIYISRERLDQSSTSVYLSTSVLRTLPRTGLINERYQIIGASLFASHRPLCIFLRTATCMPPPPTFLRRPTLLVPLHAYLPACLYICLIHLVPLHGVHRPSAVYTNLPIFLNFDAQDPTELRREPSEDEEKRNLPLGRQGANEGRKRHLL